jgi:Methyltransferase domain
MEAPSFERHSSALDFVHRTTLPRTYLEIGVFEGRSLAIALPGTTAIAVDPRPDIRYRLGRTTRVLRTSSDELFAQYDVRALMGAPVDVAFIDGLHLYEQALRDFANTERVAHPVESCYCTTRSRSTLR